MGVSGVQMRHRLRVAWVGFVVVLLVAGTASAEATATAGEVELRSQVQGLSQALAAARLENDVLKARLDRQEYEAAGEWMPGGARVREAEYRILDVNRELGMAILNAGRRQGVRPGMTFAVMQGERSVATLRVIDARAAVAGAVIETTRRYPQVQDRAIRMTGTRE